MPRQHELSIEQFNSIKSLLPSGPGKAGPNVDNYKFLNGVFYYLKTGIPWRDLPAKYGHWKSVHRRLSRWSEKGIFQTIFNKLVETYGSEFEDVQLDRKKYKERNQIERFFNKLKHFRGISTRYIKKGFYFLQCILFATFIICTKSDDAT